MRRELDDLLPELEPPPGGPAKLRAKIAASEERRSWMRGAYALVPAASAALIALAIWLPEREVAADLLRASDNPALVRLGFTARPDGEVTIAGAHRAEHAAMRVVESEEVTFYWVESRVSAEQSDRF